MAHAATITSLAVLKVHWDTHHKDYLDNFVPMVVEAIRLSDNDIVSYPLLNNDIKKRFGLNLPHSVITQLVKRAEVQGFVARSGSAYMRVQEKLAASTFADTQQEVLRKHDELLKSLREYCAKQHHVIWDEDEAERALEHFLIENHASIMAAVVSTQELPTLPEKDASVRYLVGAFVKHLLEKKSHLLKYLETVVAGTMLSLAVYLLPDASRKEKKFKRLSYISILPF